MKLKNRLQADLESQVSQNQLHRTRLVTLAFYLDILSLGFGRDLDFQIVYFILNKLLL